MNSLSSGFYWAERNPDKEPWERQFQKGQYEVVLIDKNDYVRTTDDVDDTCFQNDFMEFVGPLSVKTKEELAPELRSLYSSITGLVDIAIENEGAFGMSFGGIGFEARWKCDNEVAYAKKPESQWSVKESTAILEELRQYFKDQLNVKDEGENSD